MSSLLEERYRRVLRMLPAGFRRDWEDDMVATFLDRAYRSRPDDPEGVDISSPRWPEVASVARQAVRLRLGGGSGLGPREYVTGDALRRFALAGVLAHVVLALAGMVLAVWWTARLDVPEGGSFPSFWSAMAATSGLLWIPVYLGLLFGRHRLAVVLAILVLLPELAITLSRPDWPSAAGGLVLSLFPLVAMVAFHKGAPPVRPRPWLIAVPVLVAALVGASQIAPERITTVGLWTSGALLAGVGALALGARRPVSGEQRAATSGAAALICLAVLPIRLTVVDSAPAVTGLVALVLVGVAAAVLAGRAVRGLERVAGPVDQGWDSADASA